MKKTLSLILVLAMCLSLCACGHTHEFGEWSVISEATCIAEGSRERVCECGEKETEVLEAAGHQYGDVVELKAATCTEDGQEEQTCAICGETVTETIAAMGHDFKAATAFNPKTCVNCATTEGEPLAKLLAVGDAAEDEEHKFVVEDTEFIKDLKVKKGNVTYHHSSDGYVLAIKINFTNLAADTFERWNSDRVENVILKYMDKYNYEGECWVPVDDIVPLDSENIYIVFDVPETMSKDETGSILVTFTIDGVDYSMIVQEGEASEETQENAEMVDASGTIVIGDTKTNDSTFSFVLEDLYYTSKPQYKSGNVTYSYGTDGYYMVCKLDFTNLAAETMESWDSERVTDMTLTYADKFTYEGECWIPANEIVPLDNGVVYVLFAVSESVETGTEPLSFTFSVDGCAFTVQVR